MSSSVVTSYELLTQKYSTIIDYQEIGIFNIFRPCSKSASNMNVVPHVICLRGIGSNTLHLIFCGFFKASVLLYHMYLVAYLIYHEKVINAL